jgi:heat shock protein HslJ
VNSLLAASSFWIWYDLDMPTNKWAMAILLLAMAGAIAFVMYRNSSFPGDLVGGDKDKHGCIGSAGYSWCETKQKCLRVWEEPCSVITSFEECAAAGYPIMESYPRQCNADGQTFTEVLPPAGEIPGDGGMSLTMKTWEWTRTLTDSGGDIRPEKEGVFTATFGEDGHVSFGTDCNSAGGSYTASETDLKFGDIMSTMMYCEDSQEREFLSPLSGVRSYFFTRSGELVLETDSEKIYFK